MLGDAIAVALPGLRAQAESRMHDMCTIVDPEGSQVWNPATLQYDITPTTMYTGKCRVRRQGAQASQGEQAGQLFVQQEVVLSLPFSEPTSADVGKDHVVTVTTATDPDLVGVKFRVVSAPHQSDATARRFQVEETQ